MLLSLTLHPSLTKFGKIANNNEKPLFIWHSIKTFSAFSKISQYYFTNADCLIDTYIYLKCFQEFLPDCDSCIFAQHARLCNTHLKILGKKNV